MWKKILGWFLFALGVINVLSLLAEFLLGWLGGLPTAWPFTLLITIAMLWGGWVLAHSKTKKIDSTAHQGVHEG